jgi:hypothetical protein
MVKTAKTKIIVSKTTDTKLEIAPETLHSGTGMARFMAIVAVGAIQGSISPGAANSSCSAIGKILRILELRHKFGKKLSVADFTIDAK